MTGVRLPGALLALSPGEARDRAGVEGLLRRVEAALRSGLPAVLLREPHLSDGELLDLSRRVRVLADAAGGCWVGVHDRVHVALAARADGVHLGFRSLPPAEAARVAAGRLAVGFSGHAHDEPGDREGADYLTFGPVLETPSKYGLLDPVGFERLSEEVEACPVPVLGLGGLDPERAPRAWAVGAGVAALGGLLGGSDPAARTRAYLDALSRLEAQA